MQFSRVALAYSLAYSLAQAYCVVVALAYNLAYSLALAYNVVTPLAYNVPYNVAYELAHSLGNSPGWHWHIAWSIHNGGTGI